MKKVTVVSGAVLMGLALAACSSDKPQREGFKHEQGMHHFGKEAKRGDMMRGLRDLNLTDEQKAQIKKIIEQNRPQHTQPDQAQRSEFQNQMAQRRAAENSLITSPTFDEAAARELISRHSQQHTERMQRQSEIELQKLKTRHAIMQVLTPEQRQQWLEKQEKMREGRKPR
ncbi:hypothetical protein PL75_04960 [Neisseria arctica]|uniref:Periplasmic repressor CpxP n=1 Tax=Neisseria arctica TaxID=1470200 RepID=A0A0J1C401_9NEIS|nr:Spy/CpxP family protein refolding chaperone [Neisseria arctica]KLT73028.1 hypothetical protein PL75_04960 [Neisseria arctica]UOO86743.1 Spy/CpxP family protein refolding chaperone [Neisseria arctica]